MFINTWGYIVLLVLLVVVALSLTRAYSKVLFVLVANTAMLYFMAPKQLPVLLIYCALSYIFGLIVKDLAASKKAWVFIYLFVTVIVFGFLVKTFWADVLLQRNVAVIIFIPFGFAYVCLQNLGFILDVKHGEVESFPDILEFLAASTFFANITSGPIENLVSLGEKIRTSVTNIEQIKTGFLRIATGLCKKTLSDVVISPLFFSESSHFLTYPSLAAIPGILLKFYADFSGYTDMAIGSALVIGIKLPENFDQPYSSKTMAEYWTRWHMSLGNWFKTYLFFPLQKWAYHRTEAARSVTAGVVGFTLFLTFVLIGLWHGINWNCLIWGIFNAALVVASPLLIKGYRPENKNRKFGLIVFTMFATALGQLLLVSTSIAEFELNLGKILNPFQNRIGQQAVLFCGLSVLLWFVHQYDRLLYRTEFTGFGLKYYGVMTIQLVFIVLFYKSGTSFLYADF